MKFCMLVGIHDVNFGDSRLRGLRVVLEGSNFAISPIHSIHPYKHLTTTVVSVDSNIML